MKINARFSRFYFALRSTCIIFVTAYIAFTKKNEKNHTYNGRPTLR